MGVQLKAVLRRDIRVLGRRRDRNRLHKDFRGGIEKRIFNGKSQNKENRKQFYLN